MRKPMHKAFSALEDISFSVPAGTTLGLIGENGAGKSTLLKILAKTLSPTSGHVIIEGRVAALLELGAGFHQEFTGRQNIYLNASLMGMTDKEIISREEEIIAFADIGDFIDRPIKTYSSGMVVRLAFSIATSVDPDILVIDEALSVGDQRFQEKCVDRMVGFRKKGKTIVVCSHSMYLINELCARTLWLENGKIKEQGSTSKVVSSYLAFFQEKPKVNAAIMSNSNAQELSIKKIHVLNGTGVPIFHIKQFSEIKVKVDIQCHADSFCGHLALIIEDQQEQVLFSALTKASGIEYIKFSGIKTVELVVPKVVFQKGAIRIRCILSDSQALRLIDEKASSYFPVQSAHPEYGLIWMEHSWKI